jgi:ribosomal-protein-serine acetyltransferase
VRLARWLPWAATQTEQDTREFIAKAREEATRDESLQVAVVRDGRIVGAIGCVSVDWANRSTNIGYWLGEEFQGRGTATAAVRALTDHALAVWELNRVEIRVAPENRSSQAIPARLGFREEGVLRQAQWIGERYVDLVVYAMLAEEWAGNGAAPERSP